MTGKWKSVKELHEYMEPILNKIVSELPINLERELRKFNNAIRKLYK
jgi:hypothetical protein